jgi:NTP pyrophosphatase (non-canonical NTP hydrolase)
MISLKQKELEDWQFRNFGNNTDPFKGMVEETGEMAHALLKFQQGIREHKYKDAKKLKEDIADAFGDIVIYGIQLMTAYDINAETSIETTIAKVLQRDWINNPSGERIDKNTEEERL